MPFDSAPAVRELVGNDSANTLNINWPYYSKDHVVVKKRSSAGVITTLTHVTDYSLTAAGVAAGGTLTLVTTPATGEKIYAWLSVPQTQGRRYGVAGGIAPVLLNEDFDKLVQRIAVVEEKVKRAWRLPFSNYAEDMEGSTELADLLGKFAYFDATTGRFSGVDIDDVVDSGDLVLPVPVASGGTGQVTAALGFAALKQAASESASGVLEIATLAEALALDSSRAVPANKIASWLGPIMEPGGRLTLTTATPVMVADVAAATTIYYALHKHNFVPLWDGTVWALHQIAELSLVLDSDSGHTGYHQSGKNFDLFLYNDAGTVRLCSGPAWTNDTTRADALARKDGRYTNSASIVLRFGSASGNTVTAAANTAMFVGTFRASANGQTIWTANPAGAAGGSNNRLYLWNNYHRVRVTAVQKDSDTSHTYTTATYRAFANSNSTRISFIAGLAEGHFLAQFAVLGSPSVANLEPGIGYNQTAGRDSPKAENADAGVNNQVYAIFGREIELGHHFLQQVERATASGTATWYDSESQMFVTMEM